MTPMFPIFNEEKLQWRLSYEIDVLGSSIHHMPGTLPITSIVSSLIIQDPLTETE